MKSLVDVLLKSSQQFAHHPALTMRMGFRTVTLAYAQLFDRARRMALFLEQKGINRGDTVLICAPNSPYWIVLYWGAILRGAVVVPLNIQSSELIIQNIAKQTESRIIFHHQFFRCELPSSVERFRMEYVEEYLEDLLADDFKLGSYQADDIIQIMYTSGTTGDPKGVIHTHKNVLSNITALAKIIPLKPGKDRLLSILPLSHIFEQTIGMLLPLMYGAHIIYAHSHSAIRSLLKEYHITKLIAVPEFLHLVVTRLEAQLEKTGKKRLFDKLVSFAGKLNIRWISRLLFAKLHHSFGDRLMLIASGGAPLDPELEAKWRALGFEILQGYGLTETSPVVTCNTPDDHKQGSVGRLLDGVQIRFGENNEIEILGDNVFQGYYKNPEKTNEVFTHDGWFKTGDIGEFDEQGFLFLKGRQKYMILSASGQNVFPEDIEIELNKQPGVKDSCVIGLEKGHGAMQTHAVLLLEEGEHDVDAILQGANDNLASYQHVNNSSIWDGDDFPRTPTKKIKKEKVITWAKATHLQAGGEEIPQTSKLIGLLSKVTGTDATRIKQTTKLVQLNIDSLMRVELVGRIEEDFGVLLDENKLTGPTTVDELEEMIKTYEPPKKETKVLKAWPLTFWARCLRMLGQLILFTYSRLFVRLKVTGKENLKGVKSPVIFMPNHLSYVDAIIVARALPWRFRWDISFAAAHDMLYEEFKRLVLPAELILNAFSFPRQEHENIKPGLDRMGKIIDRGFSVVLFPEGRISEDAKLQPLKKGAGLVAVEMDCVIVPVIITGIEKIFPYGESKATGRGDVTVTFGKPIRFHRSDSYDDATQTIHQALQDTAQESK